MDVRGTLDGEEVEQLTRTDYLHRIGSGEFGPVLDGELPGTKPGDIIEFDQALDDADAGAGPGDRAETGPVHLRVLVKEVKAKKLPPLDDDLAKTASEFDTLDELRADLRDKVHELKERESVGILRDRVAGRARGPARRSICPQTLIDHETEHRVAEATARAERSGLTLEPRSWRARDGTRTASATTPATTPCGPSPPTWSWRPSPAPRTSRSRPTRSGPRSTPWPRPTSATRRSSRSSWTAAARS